MTRRTARSTQAAQEPQDGQTAQEPQVAQDAQEPQDGQMGETVEEATEREETPEETIARLQAALEEALKPRPRAPRTPKLTDKQRRFLQALQADPGASLEDLVSAAGAGGATEPHGFVYRMIANGYLDISVSAHGESMLGTAPSAEPVEDPEAAEGVEAA